MNNDNDNETTIFSVKSGAMSGGLVKVREDNNIIIHINVCETFRSVLYLYADSFFSSLPNFEVLSLHYPKHGSLISALP